MTEAFLYQWYDKLTGKKYIGVHKGTPNDGYICSSKTMLEQYSIRHEDFNREIILFGTIDEMILAESKLLTEVNAAKNALYYNMHNGDGKFYNKGHNEETKSKLKVARNKRIDKPRLGKPLSEEGKLKASASAKLRVQTEEGKQNIKKAARKSVEARKNDPTYREHLRKKAHELWEKRRKGLMPYPKRKID